MTQFTAVIDPSLVEWSYGKARAERWRVSPALWSEALSASVSRAFRDAPPSPTAAERYVKSLHLEDLALACACAAGNDAAWEHFVREQRPGLYRAADAIDPTGAARELADSLYAELYGFAEGQPERQSLFRYFHGRSRLSTWLRAVLAHRHVDRVRAGRRLEPLPDDESAPAASPVYAGIDPDHDRFVLIVQHALGAAMGSLASRDRLRLSCYYAQEMTLAETGRLLNEHEATVSRHLARSRRRIRDEVERHLRGEAHLSPEQISACYAAVARDSGPIDLAVLLQEERAADPRKSPARKVTLDRSE